MSNESRKSIKRVLISVYDKSGLAEIGLALHSAGVEIVATKSTFEALKTINVPAVEVSEYTNYPELLDGRVKTLHPAIHAGILAIQSNPEHLTELAKLDLSPFDLVIINLYPFASAIASGATFAECIEQIDIGGPTIMRGAAKNHASVAVISAPNQYDALISALNQGGFSLGERKELAIEAFRLTAEYDATIAMWLNHEQGDFPDWIAGVWKKRSNLRYGENPHQNGAIYASNFPGIASAEQLHGKEMSFNNYIDADAALRAALDHEAPAAVIIKHTNPCGLAISEDISTAFTKAFNCDPNSAFGGVVAVNRVVTSELATKLSSNFIEVVVAPDFDEAALKLLKEKKNLRLIKSELKKYGPLEPRSISGGLLVQSTDLINSPADEVENWRQVSGGKVSAALLTDLKFAWRAVRSVKSNAILLAKSGGSVGIGMGQVNRLDAARLAVAKAAEGASGSVAASDAFFPFADGLEVLIEAGVAAVVSPGGSMRDAEVIAAANSANLPLFFTETRHFSHA